MRTLQAILAISAALWPLASRAVELDLGVGSEIVYDSNVFRSGNDSKGDGSVRISPTIGLVQRYETLEVELYYKPTYEAFMTYTDANALTHYLSSQLDYRFDPKTEVTLSNLFRVQNVLTFDDQAAFDGDATVPIPDNQIGRDEFYLNDTAFSLSRAITARWSANTNVNFSLFDPRERDDTVGSKSVSAFQSFNYTMNRANQFGIGGGAVIQMFDSINNVPGNDTYIYRLFGTYQRMFGEATTLTVQLGPALIVTRQDKAKGQRDATFPFTVVEDETTVGELIANGTDITFEFAGPGEAQDGLNEDSVVPAGSVVVPNPRACVGSSLTATVLFAGSDCANTLVLRNDPGFPVEFDALPTIQTSETNVMVEGSNAGSHDSDFAIFGEVSLVHNWTPNLWSSLTYNRSESNAAGQGETTIADSVSFLTQWFPHPLWDVSLRSSYVKRESPNDLSRTFLQVTRDPEPASPTFGLVMLNGNSTFIENSTTVKTDRFEVAARAARRLTPHITVSGWAGYSYQKSKNTNQSPNDFSDFSAMLGFKYDFDPFQL